MGPTKYYVLNCSLEDNARMDVIQEKVDLWWNRSQFWITQQKHNLFDRVSLFSPHRYLMSYKEKAQNPFHNTLALDLHELPSDDMWQTAFYAWRYMARSAMALQEGVWGPLSFTHSTQIPRVDRVARKFFFSVEWYHGGRSLTVLLLPACSF